MDILLASGSQLQFDVIEELEPEPLEQDWHEEEGRPSEPRGLTKSDLEKLPTYSLSKENSDALTER